MWIITYTRIFCHIYLFILFIYIFIYLAVAVVVVVLLSKCDISADIYAFCGGLKASVDVSFPSQYQYNQVKLILDYMDFLIIILIRNINVLAVKMVRKYKANTYTVLFYLQGWRLGVDGRSQAFLRHALTGITVHQL